MELCVFSKAFKDKNVQELINLAHEYGFPGYDLCIRGGYPLNPRNVEHTLKDTVKLFKAEGIKINMITGEGSLLSPQDETAKPILSAMDKNNIRFLKLGYFRFDPVKDDYWKKVDNARKFLSGWEHLAREYNVKICYHTHSHLCLGLNCASLMHLLKGFDPEFIGAYIDPCHMVIEGEDFATGVSMAREYLEIVALKDVLLERGSVNNHGRKLRKVVPAGTGMVDWSAVFAELRRIGYNGPLSVHCEFEVEENRFYDTFREELRFFKGFL